MLTIFTIDWICYSSFMASTKAKNIREYTALLSGEEREIAITLTEIITTNLPEAEGKIWHGTAVWFIDGNPIVGYSKQKPGMRLMFWSGIDFGEEDLKPGTGKFKDASIFYNARREISEAKLRRWLEKSRLIQWDYKNIVKRKGLLKRVEI